MKFVTFCALFLMAILPVFGQQPGPRFSSQVEAQDNVIINYALDNSQQEGNFYFLPFPLQNNGNSWNPFGANGFTNYDGGFERPKAQNAQLVLRLLARFEETRKVDIVSFQLIRDQRAYNASSVFHGIFLKAKPAR